MRVPKLFKPAVVGPPLLLNSKPNHRPQSEPHDPARQAGTGGKVGQKEPWKARASSVREPSKVDHVWLRVKGESVENEVSGKNSLHDLQATEKAS